MSKDQLSWEQILQGAQPLVNGESGNVEPVGSSTNDVAANSRNNSQKTISATPAEVTAAVTPLAETQHSKAASSDTKPSEPAGSPPQVASAISKNDSGPSDLHSQLKEKLSARLKESDASARAFGSPERFESERGETQSSESSYAAGSELAKAKKKRTRSVNSKRDNIPRGSFGDSPKSSDAATTPLSKRNWGKLEFPPTKKLTAFETEAVESAAGMSKTGISKSSSSKKATSEVESEVAISNTALSEASTSTPPSQTPAAHGTKEIQTTRIKFESNYSVVKEASMSAPPPGLWEDEEAPFDEEPAEQASDEPQVMTVSDLNRHIREILEGRFPLLWLKGEISNFKAHTSGHFYFSLKDSKAQISAVMFRGFNSQLKFRPEDGMEVVIRGKITVYEPRGNYQIFCELMEPVGAGALQKAFEQLKSKLSREGLFDQARKRPLPSLPKHIVIVTSPTGAAIRDMLNVLGRRFKGADITIVPCKVQGDAAPREIIAAIQLANRLKDIDVMIVGRGGGSIEDLWAFNDEGVARAIAASKVPVISAVGHEVDFTIADFVADLRAPTPSAAAELVVKNAADLAQQVAGLSRSLKLALLQSLNFSRQRTTSLTKRLVDPQRRIQDANLRCDELSQRLELGLRRSLRDRRVEIQLLEQRLGKPQARIQRDREHIFNFDGRLRIAVRNAFLHKRESLERNMALLDSLSPLKVLDRGYSMIISDGRIATDATSLKMGQTIQVRMCKGSVEAEVKKINEKDRR